MGHYFLETQYIDAISKVFINLKLEFIFIHVLYAQSLTIQEGYERLVPNPPPLTQLCNSV